MKLKVDVWRQLVLMQSLYSCSRIPPWSHQLKWYIQGYPGLHPRHPDSPAINKAHHHQNLLNLVYISTSCLLPFLFKTLLICGAPVLPLPHDPVSSGGFPSLFLWTPLHRKALKEGQSQRGVREGSFVDRLAKLRLTLGWSHREQGGEWSGSGTQYVVSAVYLWQDSVLAGARIRQLVSLFLSLCALFDTLKSCLTCLLCNVALNLSRGADWTFH